MKTSSTTSLAAGGKAQGRVSSIDSLRGLAIFGMILCAYIGWHSDLPAWMFHAQLPPPDYAFSPDVRGITWVDLVFPFFLFSMGAAFPFAMKKRISNGAGAAAISGWLVRRWLILVCFSFVLGNAGSASSSQCSPVWSNLFLIGTWGGLFLALTRFSFSKPAWNRAANAGGVLILAAAAVILQHALGVPLSKDKCDIIILILAYVSLTGSLIWYFTRDSIAARWLVFAAVWAVKALDSYTGVFSFIPDAGSAGYGWIFKFEYLQYLMIAIPGSIVGDMMMKRNAQGEAGMKAGGKEAAAAILASAAAIFQLWGLFTRHVTADIAVTACAAAAFALMTRKRRETWSDIVMTGMLLMTAGTVFDPIDGGIRKDWCNISYLLVTSGMAAVTAGAFLFLETKQGIRLSWLSRCGQNPMIAYTITGYVTVPVLSIAGIMPLIFKAAEGSPFMGLVQGFGITAIMMALTIFFTDRKIFWRS